MIFAVAGTQLPFPRMMNALDDIAGRTGLRIVVQSADPHFTPRNVETVPFMSGVKFDETVIDCRVIVAHAGIGVMMTAETHGKPLIIMPRRADLGEHRNDHQEATARRFADVPGITVVHTAEELEETLREPDLQPVTLASTPRREALIAAVTKALD